MLGKLEDWILEKAVESFSQGKQEGASVSQDVEERIGAEYAQRRICGAITKEAFLDFVTELDQNLDRSFGETQRLLLLTRIGKLFYGESVSFLFQLQHEGSGDSLRFAALGAEGVILVMMECSGPVANVIEKAFNDRCSDFPEVIQLRECSTQTPDYTKLLNLRFKVLREPLGLAWSQVDLEHEATDRHFGLFLLEETVACVVTRNLGDGLSKLRQMVVDKGVQGRGIGKRLMELVEARLKEEGRKRVELHAREVSKGFYSSLGYVEEGELFFEVDLPHVKMIKELEVVERKLSEEKINEEGQWMSLQD